MNRPMSRLTTSAEGYNHHATYPVRLETSEAKWPDPDDDPDGFDLASDIVKDAIESGVRAAILKIKDEHPDIHTMLRVYFDECEIIVR